LFDGVFNGILLMGAALGFGFLFFVAFIKSGVTNL
jgi:hypothetical protein